MITKTLDESFTDELEGIGLEELDSTFIEELNGISSAELAGIFTLELEMTSDELEYEYNEELVSGTSWLYQLAMSSLFAGSVTFE